jgi:hypothetical protein
LVLLFFSFLSVYRFLLIHRFFRRKWPSLLDCIDYRTMGASGSRILFIEILTRSDGPGCGFSLPTFSR